MTLGSHVGGPSSECPCRRATIWDGCFTGRTCVEGNGFRAGSHWVAAVAIYQHLPPGAFYVRAPALSTHRTYGNHCEEHFTPWRKNGGSGCALFCRSLLLPFENHSATNGGNMSDVSSGSAQEPEKPEKRPDALSSILLWHALAFLSWPSFPRRLSRLVCY